MIKGLKCLKFQSFFTAFFLTKHVKETILYLKSKVCFTLWKGGSFGKSNSRITKKKKSQPRGAG